jgi:hypothetical protein
LGRKERVSMRLGGGYDGAMCEVLEWNQKERTSPSDMDEKLHCCCDGGV